MSARSWSVPSSVVVAAGLVGGYAVASLTGVRPLGGVVLAAAGVAAGRTWVRAGVPETIALAATYVGGFGLSHPLAKSIGAWPSVLTVAAVAAGASYVLADRKVARSADRA